MARWLQNETFCEELRQESQGALMASRARFALLFDQSLAILSDALQGGRVSGCERWAVSLVLRHAAALSAHFDLTARVERLEALP